MRRWGIAAAAASLAAAIAVSVPVTTAAATTATVSPSSVHVSLSKMASGFGQLTYVTSARDGSGRLFVVEQSGIVRVYVHGAAQSKSYLDIRSRVAFGGEQGLLSIAFLPGFAKHPYFYVAYTRASDGALQVSRFRASSSAATSVPSSAEVHVLTVPHPNQTNHNGGQLMFGHDGYLYITTGDGGGEGDPVDGARKLTSLAGKILRINVDKACGGANYCVPASNPHASASNANERLVFDLGLRNPWRMSVDRSDGSLWIGDVGQDSYEEIDHVTASGGKDFGWSCAEGYSTYNSSRCASRHITKPVFVYSHGSNDSNGCAVMGGYAYHGPSYSFATGLYVLADYCSGRIWALGRTSSGGYSSAKVGAFSGSITGMGEGDKGEIYAVTAGGGLYHLVFSR